MKKNISIKPDAIRLPSKLAYADEVQDVSGAEQLSVHEVLEGASTGTMKQFAAEVEFRKKSIDADEAVARLCVEAALDKKAEAPVILDLRGISTLADFFVIVSASSEPQIKAIAGSIRDRMRLEAGLHSLSDDTYPGSRWIVVDYGNIIVHIFHHELRGLYDLESLWDNAKQIAIPEEIQK